MGCPGDESRQTAPACLRVGALRISCRFPSHSRATRCTADRSRTVTARRHGDLQARRDSSCGRICKPPLGMVRDKKRGGLRTMTRILEWRYAARCGVGPGAGARDNRGEPKEREPQADRSDADTKQMCLRQGLRVSLAGRSSTRLAPGRRAHKDN